MGRVVLEVELAHDRAATVVKLHGQRFVLGRSSDCTVPVDADRVSRRHAVLELKSGLWVVEDLDSTHGTFVGGRRVTTEDVRAGDTLRLGEDGPKVRVVELDPVPFERPKPPAAESDEALRARLSSYADEDGLEPAKPRRPARWPWVLIAGLAFGVATGLELWPEAFPYLEVAAPCLWATGGLMNLVPDVAIPKAGWVIVVLLALYWASIALALRRPSWGWPWIIFMTSVHMWGILILKDKA